MDAANFFPIHCPIQNHITDVPWRSLAPKDWCKVAMVEEQKKLEEFADKAIKRGEEFSPLPFPT